MRANVDDDEDQPGNASLEESNRERRIRYVDEESTDTGTYVQRSATIVYYAY